jgi:hypothetical protein
MKMGAKFIVVSGYNIRTKKIFFIIKDKLKKGTIRENN